MLNDADVDQSAHARIIPGTAEHIRFGLFYDALADGVLVNVGDAFQEGLRLLPVEKEGAAAVLPKVEFFYPAQGLAIIFEMLHHPGSAKVHLHLYCREDGRGRIFFEISFKIRRRTRFLCFYHEVEMTCHQGPGIDGEAVVLYKIVERICNHLFVCRSHKYINLIYGIQRKEIAGVEGDDRLFV